MTPEPTGGAGLARATGPLGVLVAHILNWLLPPEYMRRDDTVGLLNESGAGERVVPQAPRDPEAYRNLQSVLRLV